MTDVGGKRKQHKTLSNAAKNVTKCWYDLCVFMLRERSGLMWFWFWFVDYSKCVAFTLVAIGLVKIVVRGAIGNGFGGDNGWMFTGTTSVGDDTCFDIVGGCFNCVMRAYCFN